MDIGSEGEDETKIGMLVPLTDMVKSQVVSLGQESG